MESNIFNLNEYLEDNHFTIDSENYYKDVFEELGSIENIKILAKEHQDRLGVISFYIDDLHYNLGVKLLNDRFGIQTRGGCSCAGTYGHFLLHVDKETSSDLVCLITSGD
jgi:selenocysteine lyase/cysteine desulfurase